MAGATTLNMIDMIGVGPFITLPLIVAAAGGPQAMLGWIFGAVFALCDGLVWAELGAAMPGAGGSYRYLKEIYGPKSLGRLLSFLFIWQLIVQRAAFDRLRLHRPVPLCGISVAGAGPHFSAHTPSRLAVRCSAPLEVSVLVMPARWSRSRTCALVVFLLYRRITAIGKLAELLWIGVALAVGWVIVAGLTHFSAARAFDFPPGAFTLSPAFFTGMGAAMLIATYDYWGYYNVCFLGGEVKDPGRTIPRALIISILAVAAIYIVMNISVLGVIPWREMAQHPGEQNNYIISVFMQRIYGSWAGRLVTALIMWTAFASVFSTAAGLFARAVRRGARRQLLSRLRAGRSRAPFPTVSLLALGGVAMLFCFLRLADVIAALVVIRILLQFIVQAVGVMVLRMRRPDMPRPFRMWLYPLPALLAIAGFMLHPAGAQEFPARDSLRGGDPDRRIGIYLLRSWRRHEWPFAAATAGWRRRVEGCVEPARLVTNCQPLGTSATRFYARSLPLSSDTV